jgi:hypothetical protein
MPDDNQKDDVNYFASDYFEVYANQALYEASAWDLKIIFGSLDQSTGVARIKKTFAVNVPWAQVKLAIFGLGFQVAVEELQDGKIRIRPALIPPEVPPPTEDQEKAAPLSRPIHEAYMRLREQFIREL